MKSINSVNHGIFSKGLLVPLFSAALLFLTLNTACNKDSNIPAIDNNDETLMSTATLNGVEITVAPHSVDDTGNIQDAIDTVAEQGGGIVWLTAGDYNINPDVSIHLKSDVTLWMQYNTTLIADASNNEHYYIIKAANIQNARVLGGQIIGDRDTHTGTGGEHGMGIGVLGCDSIRIKGTRIHKCWGDGIYIGAYSGTPSTNITVINVSCKNNRRQGLSIIEANGVTVDASEFALTNGTAPADGIDIEPNSGTAQNITITHCDIWGNGYFDTVKNKAYGNAIEINEKTGTVVKYVTMQYNKIHDNDYGYSGYFQNADHVTFNNDTIGGNNYDIPHHSNCANSTFSPNIYQ